MSGRKRTSLTLQLADSMRVSGCVETHQLYSSAENENPGQFTVLYREAMIHAGGIVREGGEAFRVCPVCEQVLPKFKGENNGGPEQPTTD
jgi:hypothetical protein